MIVKNRQKKLGPILFYRFVLIFLFLLLLLLLFVCLIVIYFFIILIVDDDDDNDDFHFTIRVFLFYLYSSVHYFYSIRFVSNKIFDSSATMLNKFCFVLFFAYFILHFLLFSPNNNVLPSTFFYWNSLIHGETNKEYSTIRFTILLFSQIQKTTLLNKYVCVWYFDQFLLSLKNFFDSHLLTKRN